jgi:hypothetical protein
MRQTIDLGAGVSVAVSTTETGGGSAPANTVTYAGGQLQANGAAIDLAGTIAFDEDGTYPAGSLPDKVQDLDSFAHDAVGASGQIMVSDPDVNGVVTLSLSPTMVAPGSLNVTGQLRGKGTSTNDDAATGEIGEYWEQTLGSASAVALTTGTAATVVSKLLPAGDWDVSGMIGFFPAGTTTVTAVAGGISTNAAQLPNELYQTLQSRPSGVVTGKPSMAAPTRRVTSDGTVTIYLTGQSNFAVSTMGAFGILRGRRVR